MATTNVDAKTTTRSGSNQQPQAQEEPFTLKVISRDGTQYCTIESTQIHGWQPITNQDEFLKEMVTKDINMAHERYASQPVPAPTFCGTYFINLSALR